MEDPASLSSSLKNNEDEDMLNDLELDEDGIKIEQADSKEDS